MRAHLELIADNVLLHRGHARALYRLAPVNYSWTSTPAKHRTLADLVRLIEAAGSNLSIHRIARAVDPGAYIDQARASADPTHGRHDRWEEMIRGHAAAMTESWHPEAYLSVSLDGPGPTGFGAGLTRRVDGLTARLRPTRLTTADRERLIAAERALRDRLAATGMDLSPIDAIDLTWLHRRAAPRGGAPLHHPGASLTHTPILDCRITEHARALEIDHDIGTSWQAIVVLTGLPEEAAFPGASAEALHHPLASIDVPVDVACHMEVIVPPEALSLVRKRVVDAHNVLGEESQAEIGASWRAHDAPRQARELEDRLTSGTREPLIPVMASLAVAGGSEEELEDNLRQVTSAYEAISVTLRRPAALQRQLFMGHLVGLSSTVRDYAITLPADRAAALMPHVSDYVSSRTGGFVGRLTVGGGRPVLIDLAEPSRMNRPPSVLLWGTLGSGKTVAAQLLATQAALQGARVLDVDPKPDHDLHERPELRGMVQLIELSGAEENRGLLDPMRLAPPSERDDLVASYLTQLLPGREAELFATDIRRAVAAACTAQASSCNEVLEQLRMQGSKEAGRALEVWSESGLGRLGFAKPDDPPTTLTSPVTSLRCPGLTLPGPSVARADHTEAERLAVATLTLLAALAMRVITEDPARRKVILFDEAWFLLGSSSGRALISRLNRMGRSMNAALLLATQRVDDIGEIEDLVGTRLVFGQETEEQSRRALELLGLGEEDGLASTLQSLRAGGVAIRDVIGRSAAAQFIPPRSPRLEPPLAGVIRRSKAAG